MREEDEVELAAGPVGQERRWHRGDPRDLVTALLALEHGLIDQAQLLAAFRSWRSSPGRPMHEILRVEGLPG